MNASSDDEGNNDEDSPETPYHGENINAYYNHEGNNYEIASNPSTNDVNINSNSDDEKNDYQVTPDTPKNGGNNETIENYEKENYEEIEKETDNENLNIKYNDKETEVNEENE